MADRDTTFWLASGVAGSTGPTGAQQKNFQAVDLDVWARQFLAAMDLYLSPEYAVPLYQLSSSSGATGGAAIFEQLVQAKETLASKIANGLDYILQGPTGAAAAGLADAQEAIKQRLQTNLSSSYATDAIIQAPFAISIGALGPTGTAGVTGTAPRLSGKPVDAGQSGAGLRRPIGPQGLTPAYTLSTAKVPLVQPTSLASFLFDIQAESQYKNFALDLDYQINELEYDIQNVANIEGYQASSWLSFIIPIGSTATRPEVNVQTRIGQVDVPLPLRSYPPPPTLVSQSGAQTYQNTSDLQDAKLWDYTFAYQHQYAAQDTTYLTITFNEVQGAARRLALAQQPDLFQRLAQFISVYPDLKNDLALLPHLKPGQSNQVAFAAAQALAQLATWIADAWQVYPPTASPANMIADRQVFRYRLDIDRIEPEDDLGSMTMTLLEGPIGVQAGWPLLYVNDDQSPIEPQIIGPDAARYIYPAGIPASAPLTQLFKFPSKDVIQIWNAWSGVSIARNQYLFAPAAGGPTGPSGPLTNPAFVYQTPLVRYINQVTPVIVQQAPIDIAQIGYQVGATAPIQKTLAEYLSQLFSSLLEIEAGSTRSQIIRVACSYGYTLVSISPDAPVGATGATGPAGVSSLMAHVPILFHPKYNFQPYDVGITGPSGPFCLRLAQTIEQWQQTYQPSPTGGVYVFDVSVFSPDDVTGSAAGLNAAGPIGSAGLLGTTGPAVTNQPLLELQNLQLKLTDIVGPTGMGNSV